VAAVTPPAAAGTLHYVFDPLCGWCYGAAPLLAAAATLPGLVIELHSGGMLAGASRRTVTPQWRSFVLPHDRRIAQLSGQPFGEAYVDGLLNDVGAPMDSQPPTAAILAAQQLAGLGPAMLQRLQKAHYVEGRRIAELAVLRALTQEIGLEPAAFENRFEALHGAATERHFEESRQWLRRLGGQGFPTLGLERRGTVEPLDIGTSLGRPAAWREHLQARLAS
jgi:putative protein-disulfide isomerase